MYFLYLGQPYPTLLTEPEALRKISLQSETLKVKLASENSRQFATPPLISLRNNIWETRVEIPDDDLGSASDWLKQMALTARPIRSTTQIWIVTRHQYGISALVSQTSFRGETCGDQTIPSPHPRKDNLLSVSFAREARTRANWLPLPPASPDS